MAVARPEAAPRAARLPVRQPVSPTKVGEVSALSPPGPATHNQFNNEDGESEAFAGV